MKFGSSLTWNEILYRVTGETKLDGTALREFFRPLEEWLRNENLRTQEYPGWIYGEFFPTFTMARLWLSSNWSHSLSPDVHGTSSRPFPVGLVFPPFAVTFCYDVLGHGRRVPRSSATFPLNVPLLLQMVITANIASRLRVSRSGAVTTTTHVEHSPLSSRRSQQQWRWDCSNNILCQLARRCCSCWLIRSFLNGFGGKFKILQVSVPSSLTVILVVIVIIRKYLKFKLANYKLKWVPPPWVSVWTAACPGWLMLAGVKGLNVLAHPTEVWQFWAWGCERC